VHIGKVLREAFKDTGKGGGHPLMVVLPFLYHLPENFEEGINTKILKVLHS
jgi:hypothetical protein